MFLKVLFMKNHLVIYFLVVTSFLAAQTTTINDVNFENYLETHSANGDIVSIGDLTSMGDGIANNNQVSNSKINNVLLLDLNNLKISDITGIASFLSLETLICSNNELSTLNVSANVALKSLLCSSNFLTSLVLNSNIALETLNFSNNQIKNLDLINNPLLESLSCSGNRLSQIDIDNNGSLNFLNISNNRLKGELKLGSNTKLENLFCSSNQISTLNLDSNTLIRNLDVSYNLLTTLDLTAMNTVACLSPQPDPAVPCQGEASINVSRNKLIDLNIANGFNSSITAFNSEDNPDLICVQIDTDYAPPITGSSAWIKDDWAYFTDAACADIYTYIPDDNFEKALIALGHDEGELDNLILTATISSLTELKISGENIADLTGIEDFLALERLDCSTNALNKLDVSANVNLTALRCYVNILPSLDISANTLLENLDCSSQKPFLDSNGANGYSFTNLNISGNAKLLDLNCSDNKLTTLNISTNTKLTSLDCSSNKIEALDVSNNTVLKKLLCNNNSLSALNLNNGNNISITSFNASSNTDLSCIEVESLAVPATGWSKDSSAKYSLGCGIYVPDDSFENYLETHNKNGDPVTLGDATSMGDGSANNNYVLKSRIATVTNLNVSSLDINNLIGIEHFVALVTLNSSNNKLTFLELSNNTALTAIDCSSNSIKNLDFSANTALTSLLCNENELFSLSIKNGNNTNLIVLDASINSNLYCIDVDDKTTIGGTWVADAIASYGNDCKLGRLTTILDVNFEQALIDLGLDANLDGSVLTSNIEHLKSLDVNDTYISDLSGIRGFSSLTALECSGNNLDELDVSNMINLEFLNCNFNYLLTNDVAKTAGVLNIDGVNNLHRLSCANNFMTDLNISNLPNLKELDCRNNSIKTLDVTTNSKLKTLKCSHNSLLTLDVSQNTALEELNCDSNQIATITPENVSNSTLTKLSCSNNNLTELFLDNYIILESLSCGNNQITGIDLTANLALKTLDNSNNKIVDIDLVNNVNLQSLFCSNNEFSQLDLNTNVFLKTLDCSSNKITNLALNSNTLLKYLSVSDNQLSVLNLANNTNLVELDISLNVIEDLTLASDITALKTLNASKNKLAGALDLSGMGTAACPLNPNNPSDFCPTSISIDLSENALQFVNLKNGINAKISNFDTLNNPNLSCIEIDDVAAIGENWFKAAATEYSLNCHFGETYVPDDNFELALIALGYDSLPLDNYVSTSNIDALTSLDINGESITDLTGIQNFTALQTLVCSNNSLSILELKNNVALSQLDCSNNAFSAIDFSDNLALKTIDCSNNLLLNLNLSANSNLLHLNISNNSFSIFLPSEIPSLQDLNCDSNQLTMLDLSSNTALTALSCESNLLETLNIKNGQNSNLLRLNVQNNPDLTCIETDTGEEPNGVTWLKAATTTYQINCYYGQTFVPDNAFEQALINKGIDQGGLDDYVLTESINTISFLNISNNNIEDLTGIEDFKNLQNLNFSNNIVARLDVSKNILLKELHAANNLLLELDLVSNVALEVVNILGNSLEGINLDANINILELNVSNNQLSALDIAALVHLQNLDCSTNMLQSLSIALNVQLVNLYCQSNLFISDQLNLRNGVNSNLVNFNATDNSALICILVDDPFAVIENSVGTYDGWNKDSTANYQSVCLDADNDGVVNEDDDCPNSVFGQPVNLFGCEYLMLPNDNFTILTIGETCLNSNNGKIKITAVANFSYTATITSDSFEVPFSTEYKFSNDVEIRNLLAGSYKVCIAIQEWPDYTNCYAVVINQPEVLGVLTAKSSDNRKVLLDLSGNVNYNIDINGLKFTVNTNQLSLNLDKGENSIKVSTDLACQGIYEERIFVPNLPFVYPNPFSNQINISLGKSDANTRVHIQSSLGHSVYSKTFTSKESRALIIDTGLFSAGVYIISIKTIDSVSTFKIVKK